jgi:hypothetical protein
VKSRGIRYTFVAGVGPFPIDMLRYDNCWPATESDSGKVMRSVLGERVGEVQIAHADELTAQRWKSFSWAIVDSSHYPRVRSSQAEGGAA